MESGERVGRVRGREGGKGGREIGKGMFVQIVCMHETLKVTILHGTRP